MTGKMALIALSAAVALGMAGAATVAQANDNNSGEYLGGYDIGPLGQCFNPAGCAAQNGNGSRTYGFVAPAKHKHQRP